MQIVRVDNQRGKRRIDLADQSAAYCPTIPRIIAAIVPSTKATSATPFSIAPQARHLGESIQSPASRTSGEAPGRKVRTAPLSKVISRTAIHVIEQPCRNIALAMQHAPDVDVIAALDVEDQVRVARQRP